ncbi:MULTISPECIES: DUF4422 domain-containing protein [unclassified Gemella]|uniref:DUF4422 domain-containing protein n=1 Tax=unclassified Gemella TaxID=2624949 RepID=UPI0015CFDD69|nr:MULTISPECIES: DUF4422 domain-containing protein [unclassified Gemella]MBF0709861.1 DUF4422 domain-containing protein [Gemella sp. GL1.1]NYS27205.1 DUF4422 domain-containing protein [Gemella sp. GL1]
MDVKILVGAHKEVDVPKSDIYLPIQVGAGLNNIVTEYQKDNEGDNISADNPYFSELTALYWAWKNLDIDYIGLVHYRRYLSTRKHKYSPNKKLEELIVRKEDLISLLGEDNIIVPAKRKYYIESLYSHYANTFDAKHLDKTRDIISETCSDYLANFDKVMKQNHGYMFNMFIANKKLADQYCEWLFPILFELQKRVSVEGLTPFEARLFGRVSERLFNVWLDKNNIRTTELPLYDHFKVNWLKKGSAFLTAKIFKKKYEKSF